MHAKITFKNAEEFQKLLERATALTNQLEDTLQQINGYKPDVEVNIEATAVTALENEPSIERIAEGLANQIEKGLRSIT